MKNKVKILIFCMIVLVTYTGTSYGWFGKKNKIDWPTAEVTEENIRAALSQKPTIDPLWKDSNFAEKITKIDITDHAVKPGQKIIGIWYEMDDAWDETDLVKKAGGTAIIINSIHYGILRHVKLDKVRLK